MIMTYLYLEAISTKSGLHALAVANIQLSLETKQRKKLKTTYSCKYVLNTFKSFLSISRLIHILWLVGKSLLPAPCQFVGIPK